MFFFRSLYFLFFIYLHLGFLYSTPDLTIVGFIKPEDGIGKISINILETLGDDITTNVIINPAASKKKVSSRVMKALNCPDKTPGKIALLTDVLGSKNSTLVPSESIVKLAYSMLETTKIPSAWVNILNEKFDAVIVPDPFLVKIYESCGVKIPIFILPIPMMLDSYFAHSMHSKSPSTPFVFGDASANKNPVILVKAFAKAFGNYRGVRLVLRAGVMNQETKAKIHHLTTQLGLTNVVIEEGYLSLNQYIENLSSFDCYVNLSRGEGFSFIPREALALGIPCILANNTASTTICKSHCVKAIPSQIKRPANPIYQILFHENCGEQFDCKVEDVVEALQDVYLHYEKYIKKARKGRQWVNQYNCANPELQKLYRTLIKPKSVVLGNENIIKDERIETNSFNLYQKYLQIINGNS